MPEISLARLMKALANLKRGYRDAPSELERDGINLRFKYTLELLWKKSKEILQYNGIEADTPKNIVEELARLGWISNPDKWIDYINRRNKTSYSYNEEVSQEIFSVVKSFINDAEKLVVIFKSNIRCC